ncbi:MAG TPA: type I 3-dehydroquinate dehydratase [Archaeoglobaceae archaeon]|nr:type I 3-dehydroquinate dehydratase [Archaeoglobaceae archaeon]
MQIIVSLTNIDDFKRVEDVADLIELRIDLFNSLPSLDELKKIRKKKIVTIRRKEDGGKYTGSEADRLNLIKKYSGIADYVDVEFDCEDEYFEMNCKTIESYHNFSMTPPYNTLKEILDSRRGDIFKIATLGKTKKDVLTIVKILCNYDDVVAFLIGEKFAFTRIMSLFLGSPFIYCHAGNSVARGQFEAHEASEIIKKLRGER